jgi:hypothetical protein
VLAEAFPMQALDMAEYSDLVRDDIAEDAMEPSDLIGFWVTCHMAGSFAALENGGWHGATIFRKGGASVLAMVRTPTNTRSLRSGWTSTVPRPSASSAAITDRRPGFFH